MQELLGTLIAWYIVIGALFLVFVAVPALCVKGYLFYVGKCARKPSSHQ